MKPNPIRNRIVGHLRVRAGDLVPHPHNYRQHPKQQRQALAASLQEVGFARSLVGVRLADGRVQLIDGHLRAEQEPDLEVVVELLDLTPAEADQLLMTLDPLSRLAGVNSTALEELMSNTETDSQALQALWDETAADSNKPESTVDEPHEGIAEQWLVLVTCESEQQQIELLERFEMEGLLCKPLIS
jgi:hypothetical protein